jgi:hypothetical protein
MENGALKSPSLKRYGNPPPPAAVWNADLKMELTCVFGRFNSDILSPYWYHSHLDKRPYFHWTLCVWRMRRTHYEMEHGPKSLGYTLRLEQLRSILATQVALIIAPHFVFLIAFNYNVKFLRLP